MVAMVPSGFAEPKRLNSTDDTLRKNSPDDGQLKRPSISCNARFTLVAA